MSEKTTILLTGSAGFIGYHLAEALLNLGYRVIGLDNINSYYDVNLKIARLAKSGISVNMHDDFLKAASTIHAAYSFYKCSISDKDALYRVFETEKPDIVINLAAHVGVRASENRLYDYIDSNIIGFANILESCKIFNVKHLIYASSSSVYGNNSKVPFTEDDFVDYPASFYAATKKSNELMAHVYSHNYKLPVTGLRFFTVYGPWGRPDMAPSLFASAIFRQEPLNVFNEGKLERDFTFISDIVNSIMRLIQLPPDQKTAQPYYQLFNIGNSQKVPLIEFIDLLENIIGKTTRKQLMPMQKGDVMCTWADSSRLQALTGYKPCVGLEEGLIQFIAWFKDYYRY